MMDREQFTSAVLAAEPTLYRVAKTMLRSEYDCADAAQQAILRAWEQLDSLRSTRLRQGMFAKRTPEKWN